MEPDGFLAVLGTYCVVMMVLLGIIVSVLLFGQVHVTIDNLNTCVSETVEVE
jgi:hypothetical protein